MEEPMLHEKHAGCTTKKYTPALVVSYVMVIGPYLLLYDKIPVPFVLLVTGQVTLLWLPLTLSEGHAFTMPDIDCCTNMGHS